MASEFLVGLGDVAGKTFDYVIIGELADCSQRFGTLIKAIVIAGGGVRPRSTSLWSIAVIDIPLV